LAGVPFTITLTGVTTPDTVRLRRQVHKQKPELCLELKGIPRARKADASGVNGIAQAILEPLIVTELQTIVLTDANVRELMIMVDEELAKETRDCGKKIGKDRPQRGSQSNVEEVRQIGVSDVVVVGRIR
jgi:hypothetical protein